MLSKEKIDELKKEYGKVFKVNIAGSDYVYRPLMRKEYREMQEKAMREMSESGTYDPSSQLDIEDDMLLKCVVYPEDIKDIDSLPAGVGPSLSAYVADASGFNADAKPEEL